jgi:hypothetical protein
MKDQLHARATARQIEELSEQMYKLQDEIAKLKTLRVAQQFDQPPMIPMPANRNTPPPQSRSPIRKTAIPVMAGGWDIGELKKNKLFVKMQQIVGD